MQVRKALEPAYKGKVQLGSFLVAGGFTLLTVSLWVRAEDGAQLPLPKLDVLDADEGYEWLGSAEPCLVSATEWRQCSATVALDTARNSRNRAHHRPRVNRSVLWLSTTQPVRGGVDAHILLERPPQPTLSRKQKGRSHRATARAAQRVASAAYACRMVAVPRCVSQATEPPWSGPGLASRRCTHPSRFSHA
jgi:hypothetical protein